MKNLIITVTIFVLAALTACNSTESSELTFEEATKDKSKQKDAPAAFNFNEAQPIDSTNYVLYPLGITANNEIEDEYGYKRGTQYYRNIIFYNTATQKYHLLDNRKMLISSYSVDDDDQEEYSAKAPHKKAPHLIFYKVRVDDYNGNGKLDDKDPEYLFISDVEGSYFKQISPDNLNVSGWKAVSGKVLIEITKDTNGDKEFKSEEAGIPYVYDKLTGSIATPVFNKAFTDSVGTLLHNQWATKKN